MDQGVFRTWEAHYRQYMMRHMIMHVETHTNEDMDNSIHLLHAIRCGVDTWKTEVKPITLEHCFEASKVKSPRHFPLPLDLDVGNIQEVGVEILDCIRSAHPGLQIPQSALRTQFIHPATEIVENPVNDIENRILAA